MAMLAEKRFTIVQRGPPSVKEDMFRFDVFLLLIEEWVRRKLKMRITVECLR